MADNDAPSYAFTVPGLGITPGQALMFKQQQAQQEQSRQDAINERAQYRQDQEKERNEFRQSNLLKEEFNPTKYQTGVGLVDQYTEQKLSDLLRQYSDPKYASMPLNEFTGMVRAGSIPISSGASAVKNKLAQETAIIKNAVAQNKYLDGGKLMEDVRNKVANEFMIPDQKGGFTFRPLDQVNMNKSDALDILSSPNAYNYVNNQGISDYLKGIKESATSAKPQTYSLKRPDGGTAIYQGRMSPFQQMVETPDQYGFVKQQPRYSVVSEPGRVDRMGNPIKTVPEDILNKLTDTPGNAMVFNKLFSEYAGRAGINENDPVERQKFAYTMLNNTLGNEQPFVHSQQQPQKAAHTTINMGASQAIDDNQGYLAEHFDEARQNNPQTFYNSEKKQNEVWGQLPIEKRYTTQVKDPVTQKLVQVPFDKYFVTPDNKVLGVVYKRDESGDPTHQVEQQMEIPIKQYTTDLLKSRVGIKHRAAVVDSNVKELQGASQQQNQKQTTTKKAIKGF